MPLTAMTAAATGPLKVALPKLGGSTPTIAGAGGAPGGGALGGALIGLTPPPRKKPGFGQPLPVPPVRRDGPPQAIDPNPPAETPTVPQPLPPPSFPRGPLPPRSEPPLRVPQTPRNPLPPAPRNPPPRPFPFAPTPDRPPTPTTPPPVNPTPRVPRERPNYAFDPPRVDYTPPLRPTFSPRPPRPGPQPDDAPTADAPEDAPPPRDAPPFDPDYPPDDPPPAPTDPRFAPAVPTGGPVGTAQLGGSGYADPRKRALWDAAVGGAPQRFAPLPAALTGVGPATGPRGPIAPSMGPIDSRTSAEAPASDLPPQLRAAPQWEQDNYRRMKARPAGPAPVRAGDMLSNRVQAPRRYPIPLRPGFGAPAKR